MSNCSSGSDSSLSWGEDNFEGEATRQVTLLFEQLDNLLFSDLEQFTSYPVVPLHRSKKKIKEENVKKSAENNQSSRHNSPNKVRSQKGAKNAKDVRAKKRHRAFPWKSQNSLSDSYSGSDSGDEVVWETLPRPKKDAKNKLSSKKQRNDLLVQRRQQKTLRKKLSTISELGPHSKKSLSDESLNVSLLEVKHKIRHYSESDGEDVVAFDALDNVDIQHFVLGSSEISNGQQSEQEKEIDENSHPDDGVSGESNLRGGIYAMGFTAPVGIQVTSPVLLPTPATPPGVPLQPTQIMVEESSYWSSRFPYLRVTGHGINPLQLKHMEELAFAKETLMNESPEREESESSVSSKLESSSSEEEYLAHDGMYESNAGHLCLTGSYLPHTSTPQSKPSLDAQSRKSDPVENSAAGTSGESSKSESRKSSRESRRVWSGSQDPAVLKEQVLLMLFDSVWPQVINIVGGLVHRYSCHLLARVAAHSTSARSSRTGSSSTVSEMEVWRRLDSASIFSRRSSLQNSFGSSSREASGSSKSLPRSADPRSNIFRRSRNTSDYRVADIEEEGNFSSQNRGKSHGSQLKRSKSSAGRSRLSTAKALMQIQHSPACSSEANVVSLPSLDIRALRPLSSVSSLSSLSTTRLSASSRSRVSSLTLDMETGRREDSGQLKSPGVSFGASPRWARPFEGPFLPPISTPASPAILAASSALDISRDISPKKRVFGSGSGHRLARRNSDSMAKLKEERRAHSSGVVPSVTVNVRSPAALSNSSRQNVSAKVMSTDVDVNSSVKGSSHENMREFDSKTNEEGRASRDTDTKAASCDRKTGGEASSSLASEGKLKQHATSHNARSQRFTKTKNPAPRDLSYPGRRNKSHGRRRWNDDKHSFVSGSKSIADVSDLSTKHKSRHENATLNNVSSSPHRSKNRSDTLTRRYDSEKQLDIVGTSCNTYSRGQQHDAHRRKKDKEPKAVAASHVVDQATSHGALGGSTGDTGLFRFGDYYERFSGDDGKEDLRTSH